MGILLLLAGWVPYILGSVLMHDPPGTSGIAISGVVQAAMNVVIAASAGALGGMLHGQFRYRKADTIYTYSGLLGGLVAISAGAGAVSGMAAVIIGGVAGLLVPMITLAIDMRLRWDDPLGVIGVLGFGGFWGTLAVGLLATGALGEGRVKLLAVQAMGIVVVVLLSGVVSVITFSILKAAGGLRVTEADEFDGLDLGEHDVNGYPDFQQTTIKSYHLREA